MEKLVIVTGTSRGIGAAVAAALLEGDWEVLGLARGPAQEGLGGPRYTHQLLDLGDLGAAESWWKEALGAERLAPYARLALVNNAAVLAPVAPATDLRSAELAYHMAVNLVAPTCLAGHLVGAAAPGASVRIVNLSSGAATRAYAGWSAYCAGKAALRMTGEVLSEEARAYPAQQGRDLAVITYAPHVVATRMQEELRATDEGLFPARQRFVDLDEGGLLVDAQGPAREVAALIDSAHLPPYSERRYQPPTG